MLWLSGGRIAPPDLLRNVLNSEGVKNACADGVKNDCSPRGFAVVAAGGTVQETRVFQKWPDGLEKFRCHLRRGALDLPLSAVAAHRRASLLRKRASSEKKANIGPSATAENPFV